uniref:F-box domain-containing protein n=1 Tax=Davidia involucrata TaxID=16924 RepID=A0A5B7BWI3_DAVIN
MTSNNGEHQLPQDVVIEILSRLPVKSLMRFSCVCKNWYALIRNPNFITKHHNHHHHSSARLFVYHYNYSTENYAFAHFPDETLANAPLVYQDHDDLQMSRNLYSVIGPFNGLICLFNGGDRLALWNPATREFRPLPIAHHNLPPHFNTFSHNFGFGLDLVTNDYKLVWIRVLCNDELDYIYDPTPVALYTLATGSWRHLEVVLPPISSLDVYDSLCNTYLNGIYYWATQSSLNGNYMILTFDMGNEIFGELPGPPDVQCGELAMYNGSIAMLVYDSLEVEKYFDIWVMKEEEEGCWTKQLTIGPLQGVVRPLGFWKNDELFLESRTSQLVLYNPDTQEIENLGPRGKDFNSLKVLIYKESLVSVEGGNECHRGDNSSNLVKVQDFLSFDLPITTGSQAVEEAFHCFRFIPCLVSLMHFLCRRNNE